MQPTMDVLLLGKEGLRTLTVLSAALLATSARAEVAVSAQPTQNMSCSNGVCAPTAKSAVLNAGDLEALLASSNVTVTTTGTGVQAGGIHVSSALGWANSSTLSLEAHRSVAIDAAVSITGQSGLTLDTGKKGALLFGKTGNVTFGNLSSQLTINGSAYTLVGNVKTLASDIASSPGGNFALANNYDAGPDGTYGSSPVGIVFTGTFEGLGNVISNLSIAGGTQVDAGTYEGLFVEIGANGTARDIGLSEVQIDSYRSTDVAAALVGLNLGAIQSCFVTGTVLAHQQRNVGPAIGGLVGYNEGAITYSYSAANVAGKTSDVGGLAAVNEGTISGSYATGSVSGPAVGGLVGAILGGTVASSYASGNVTVTAFKSHPTFGGGLLGELMPGGTLNNSYATGAVAGAAGSDVGGLLGSNDGTISSSYSTGAVTGGTGSTVGGLIGVDDSQAGSIESAYWDTDTSGIANLSQGAGNIANDPGITGLTTAEFQSGLPAGFDPSVWAERSNIDDGFPYLIANPPAKQK